MLSDVNLKYLYLCVWFDCYVLGDDLPTAEVNQTGTMIAYLAVDQPSRSQLTRDSNNRRENYICQFSGRSLFFTPRALRS